jgi:hypothetical protein
MNRPVGIAQEPAGQHHAISLPQANDLIGLFR